MVVGKMRGFNIALNGNLCCCLIFLTSAVFSLPLGANDTKVEDEPVQPEQEGAHVEEQGESPEARGFFAATSAANVAPDVIAAENANLSVVYRQGDLLFHSDSYLNGELRGSWQLSSRWPGGVLVYRLDPNFSQGERAEIFKAMNLITSKTCIRFLERTNQYDYLNLVRAYSGGCTSYFGRVGGPQPINLQAPTCLRAVTIAHEFIHAIGFVHEQSRPDRDNFVTINWGNIYSNQYRNFDKFNTGQVNTFNTPYDYQSIMHYPRFAFAVNPSQPTIIPKQAGSICGECQITNTDAQEINLLYRDICGTASSAAGPASSASGTQITQVQG